MHMHRYLSVEAAGRGFKYAMGVGARRSPALSWIASLCGGGRN
jgi:hypothetical protein